MSGFLDVGTVLPEDTVESVDTTSHPLQDPDEERDRFLRQAAG